MSTNHILHSRYNYLLSPLRSFDHTSETLCEKGFISSGERAEIQAILTEEEKRSTLCDILSAKGAASLVEVSEVLTLEHQKQSVEARNGFNVVTASSSSSSSSSTGTAVSGGGDGRSFEGREYGGRWGEEQRTPESAWRHQGDDAKHQQGENVGSRNVYERSQEEFKVNNQFTSDEVRDRQSFQQEPRLPPSQLGLPVNGKHLKTDVPDPPVERLSAKTAESAYMKPDQGMEDAFIVLFFTLITQQLQLLWSNKPRNSPTHHRPNATPQDTQQIASNSVFPWLHIDVPSEEARDYFPAEVVKSVTPSLGNPAHLKLSMVLEAFQQFMRAFENLKHENLSLQRKGRMYDELSRKFRALESKMTQMQQQAGRCGHGNATPPEVPGTNAGHSKTASSWNAAPPWNATPPQVPVSPDSNAALHAKRVAELEEQVKLAEPLQQAYSRSEERCVQLVEVTQQWAIECEEKVRMIEFLEKEADQLKGTLQQLDARVAKYKKYWMETKDVPRAGRVSDAQFEELRTELAMRRELYDQVLAERDEAVQKVKVLTSEIESLKDHNVQLEDRAANFKVQAQAKEPSVREMSVLLEQKGRLEHEVEKLKKGNAELSDKVLALEILVEDLTSKVNHLQGASPQKQLQPHPRRADAMVIGYNHLTTNPAPSHIRAPPGSHFLAPSSAHAYLPYHKSSASEDDIMSLESSDAGSGSFTSHDSTSDRKQTFVRSFSGHSSPSHHSPMPHLKSREPLLDPEVRSCDVPPRSHDTKPRSHDLEMAPPPFGSDDYTSHIRYPNNSRILVQPLLDEDISLKGGSTGRPKVRESSDVSKEPYYCDRSHFDQQQQFQPLQLKRAEPPNQPTAILPPHSPFFIVTPVERKCPVCQHSFLTLSETEFNAHVAVCFK